MKQIPNARPNARPSPVAVAPRPPMDRPRTSEERRRAQRVYLRLPVAIHVAGKIPLEGNTHTLSVSGALVIVPEPVAEGTVITIENVATRNRVAAKVTRPPQVTADGAIVPIEFSTPSPTFWNVFFPPVAG